MEAKTAFITGASVGLGRALARKLAARGVEVCVAARREPELRALADEIHAAGGRAHVFPLDVADPLATVAALSRADDQVGGIDLVVANAGVGKQGWSGRLRWEDYAPTIAVNVTGAAATLVALLPRMVERGRGHLVGVSSLAQHRGFPKQCAYSATKAFLSNFLESLRIDLRGTPISVTDVRPGFIRTAMTEANQFRMPFLLEPDAAAGIVLDGIERRRPVVEFPLPTALGVRIVAALPRWLYEPISARTVAEMRRRGDVE